jgi:hypothetical protein
LELIEERQDFFMTNQRGAETDYMRGQIEAYDKLLKDVKVIKKLYKLTSDINNELDKLDEE